MSLEPIYKNQFIRTGPIPNVQGKQQIREM